MTRRERLSALLAALAIIASIAYVHEHSGRTPSADAGATTTTEMYGAMQAATHTAAVTTPPIVPFIRTLSDTPASNKGCQVAGACPAIFQLQRALKAAKVRTAKATGYYGAGTRDEVKAFQRAHKIAATGIYGPVTHHALSKFYDKAGRARLEAVVHARTVIRFRARLVTYASYAWKHRTSMAYSEGASRGLLPALPGFPRATDCSGYVTWLYKVSGLPDPSGFNYTVVGYTGTLAQHGTRVPAGLPLKVGDLVYYGGGFPYGHVAMIVNGFLGLVTSHGSPGIKVLPYRYRAVSAVRRYM